MFFLPPGTLWNLSSNEDFIKDLVDKPLSAVVDEVLVLHSGVEQKSNGAEGGKGDSKSPYQEWEKAFINSTGFLRYGPKARGWVGVTADDPGGEFRKSGEPCRQLTAQEPQEELKED